jgi:hypothetical protein
LLSDGHLRTVWERVYVLAGVLPPEVVVEEQLSLEVEKQTILAAMLNRGLLRSARS